MPHRLFPSATFALGLAFCAMPAVAAAEEAAETPPPATEEQPDKPETPAVPPKRADTATVLERLPAVVPCCPRAAIPVYIESWGRLAELTQSDQEIAPVSEFWRARHENTSTVAATGAILGGGAILLGTVNRLTSDGWTTANKWEIAGGAGAVLASVLTWWLFSPDRDDLLTVINHWNLRHQDRPLAP